MNRFTPYTTNRERKRVINFDRHCQQCNVLIKGAAHQKPGSCFKCGAPQEGRQGWSESGWGRCADCDGWMNRNHCYCLCGFANAEAIERKKLQQEAARQQAAFRKEQETADLRRQLGEAARVNMALQQQIDVREEADRHRQNDAVFVQQMQGVNLENDDIP